MKKNLEEIIKIQKELIEGFDEELFLLEEEYLSLFSYYPLLEELNGDVNSEKIEKAKAKILEEIKGWKAKNEKEI